MQWMVMEGLEGNVELFNTASVHSVHRGGDGGQ